MLARPTLSVAIRYFSKVHPSLKESSVRTWKKNYLIEMAKKRKAGEEATVKELVNKKRGRPVLLGCDLDRQVRAYLSALHSNGASPSPQLASVAYLAPLSWHMVDTALVLHTVYDHIALY